MALNPMAALARARSNLGRAVYAGRCQAFVVNMYGAGGGAASASLGWQAAAAAGHGHRDSTPPIGSAVYWTGGSQGFGHTAIVSKYVNGKPYVISTGINGRVAEVPLSYFGGSLKYRGWASSLNGAIVDVSKFGDLDATPDYTPSPGSGGGGDSGEPKEQRMTRKQTAENYGYGLEFLNSVPELKKLFSRAFAAGWTADRFLAEFRGSGWYKQHSATWRQAYVEKMTDPATYKQKRHDTMRSLYQAATQMGATLSGNVAKALAEKAIAEGWSGDAARYATELSAYIDAGNDLTGTAGEQEDYLREAAWNLGISQSDDWYRKGAISVVGGRATSGKYEDMLKEAASKKYAAWADQIQAGQSVRELASSHLAAMADLLEVDIDALDFDDPLLVKALRATGDDGSPSVMDVSAFQREIRKDERWRRTKNAREELTSIGYDVLSRFGMAG